VAELDSPHVGEGSRGEHAREVGADPVGLLHVPAHGPVQFSDPRGRLVAFIPHEAQPPSDRSGIDGSDPDTPGTIGCTAIPPHQKKPLERIGLTEIALALPGNQTNILNEMMHRGGGDPT
jgi:hypothetical protein